MKINKKLGANAVRVLGLKEPAPSDSQARGGQRSRKITGSDHRIPTTREHGAILLETQLNHSITAQHHHRTCYKRDTAKRFLAL